MKRFSLMLPIFFFAAFGTSGCMTAAVNNPVIDLRKDFKLAVLTEKTTYSENEPIKIWATLEYIGNNDQISIWHPLPYVSFAITDEKDINMNPVYETVLDETILVKGTIYRFDFEKSGVYEPTEINSSFWMNFYNQKELFLPIGIYTIKVKGVFTLSKHDSNYNNNLEEEITIKVQ